jgi:hypothetical protein
MKIEEATKRKNGKWDNEKLESLRVLANKTFPSVPIKSIDYMKQIIRRMERKV